MIPAAESRARTTVTGSAVGGPASSGRVGLGPAWAAAGGGSVVVGWGIRSMVVRAAQSVASRVERSIIASDLDPPNGIGVWY